MTSDPTTDFIERLRGVWYWERLVLSKVVKLLLRETIKATEEVFNDADVAVVRACGEVLARARLLRFTFSTFGYLYRCLYFISLEF